MFGSGKEVLIVDDDPLFRELVVDNFIEAGFAASTYASVEEAIDRQGGSSPFLIVTDIFMPGIGGLEGIPLFKEKYPDASILAISGGWNETSPEEALREARSMGAHWGLKKPFTFSELSEALSNISNKLEIQLDSAEATGQDIHILIVDDDIWMCDFLQDIIENHPTVKAHADIAHNGRAAIKQVSEASHPYDVILCDLYMPDMDGIQLLTALSKEGFEGGVIVVSGAEKQILKMADKLSDALEINLLGVLAKPIQPDTLEKHLENLGKPSTAGGAKKSKDCQFKMSEQDLIEALDEDRVVMHYQPIVSVPAKKLVAVEALVRINNKNGELIFPDCFISIAEDHGLIDELTKGVINQTTRDHVILRDQGIEVNFAINFSPQTIDKSAIVDFLVQNCEAANIDLSMVTVEITESAVSANEVEDMALFTSLKMKGVNLSIDDFGTGYSSLSRLEDLPFNKLKIDRRFVQGALEDSTRMVILESSITMAQKLNIPIVAEGVEIQEEWDLMESLKVDMVQGYIISKPLFIDDLIGWNTGRSVDT